jgi:hypothetical protein
MLKTVALGTLAGLLALSLTGCATSGPQPDYACKSRDQGPIMCQLSEIFNPTQAPWDPQPGQTLFDQIPNWDGEALDKCCGGRKVCAAWQTPRC